MIFPKCKELHTDDYTYGYTTGRIRMLENRLLDRTLLGHIIDSTNVDSAIKQLETKYGNLSLNAESLKAASDFESVLSSEIYKSYTIIKEFAPNKDIIDLFFYKYMFHNLKVIIKSQLINEAMDMIYFNTGPIPVLELRDILINNSSLHPISQIKTVVENKFNETKNPQTIDLILDQEYFIWIKNFANNLNLPIANEIVKIWIDLGNIKNLFRCLFLGKEKDMLNELIYPDGNILREEYLEFYEHKNWDKLNHIFNQTPYIKIIQTGIEGLKNNSMEKLELNLDNYLLTWLDDCKYITFGIEPLISYIIHKEHELKLIRIVIISKIYKIPPDIIRKRLGIIGI